MVELEPHTLLAGRSRVVRKLARGGMGVVYEAYDERLGRRIALKTARPGLAALLAPEVRHASTISHPHVCKIFELHSATTPAGEIDFITMELVEGETLARRLARGALPFAEARTIALQLCAALSEAHRNGVIHGDLKPANVLIARSAEGALRAVIMDFGLARGLGPDVSSGGTPGYMAPEMHAGTPSSVRTDIYALGRILDELATASQTGDDRREEASTLTIATDEPPVPATHASSKRSPWTAIIARCLATDPAARYSSVADVQRALDPPRARIGILVGALLAIAAVTGFAYWKVNTPPETVKLAVDSAIPVDEALARLRGTRTVAFRIAGSERGATHRLRVTRADRDGHELVTVELNDVRAESPLARWQADYEPAEAAFIPEGVAGVVSATLHLAPSPRALTMPNDDSRAYYERALPLLRDDNRLDEAQSLIERARALAPASPLPWAAFAELSWRRDYLISDSTWVAQWREAVRRAELRGQDTPEVHRIAGLLDGREGRLPQAIARYQRATELPSSNADSWRRLGEAYRRTNQPDAALMALKRAVEVEPGFYRTHQDLASWYFGRGDYATALPGFETAVRLAPDNPRTRTLLSETFMNLGRFQDAERELRTGLAHAEDMNTLFSLGLVLMYQGRDAEAVTFLRRATSLDAGQPLPALDLGDALLRSDHRAEAETAFRTAFAILQTSLARDPQQGLSRTQLGYVCARLGDRARAESEIEQGLRSAPDAADAMWFAALTYEALGQRSRALEVLARAPRSVLEDLARWPMAKALAADPGYQVLLASAATSR